MEVRSSARAGRNLQNGMSTLGWLIVLAVVGFALTAAIKLGPLYIDNYFVASAVESLGRENLPSKEVNEIRQKLDNEFSVNNVRDIKPTDIQIVRESGRTLVKVDYERRVPFMGNIDVVVKFTNHVDSAQHK